MLDMTRSAIIVSHGQPSDTVPAAEALATFAAAVAALLPGWHIGSATLAEADALTQAARAQRTGVIFPMFMTGGYFTRVAIPARLRAGGVSGWQVLEPFGCDPAVHDLTVAIAREAGADQVLLAAHGSFKSPVPSDIARHVAGRIAGEVGVRAKAAFIDQDPQLAGVQGFGRAAVCLPFFAAAGGHVVEDIPAALAKAGFGGRLLPPVGLDHRVPGIVAAAIAAGQPVCAGECRWRK
jgi:sirohydrochlorin ferrochelatase